MLPRLSCSSESSDGLLSWAKSREEPDCDGRLSDKGLASGVSNCVSLRVRFTDGVLMAYYTDGESSDNGDADPDREKMTRPRHKRMRRDWRMAIRF